MRSERVDAFAAALLSQRLAGGDLAGLLRRFAAGAAERDRVAEDARSATAQARFTGLLVVAMPTGGALFAELLQPGFLAKLLGLAARGGAARRSPRRCSSPASSRSGASRGWSSERRRAACGARGPARLRRGARAAGRRAGRRAAVRLAALGRGGAAARLPSAARSGLERGSAAAVLPRSSPAAAAACRARRAGGAGRTALLVVVGLPAAGFLAARRAARAAGAAAASGAWSRRCPTPSTCSRSAPAPAAARRPGFEQLARGGRGAAGRGAAADRRRALLRRPARRRPARRCARRVPGSELATLVAAIERSRRFGSPLADQLRRQASALRRDSRRAVEERAARAAPKIQLVVALVLVPSVLLMIAAGLIANAGTLLAGF